MDPTDDDNALPGTDESTETVDTTAQTPAESAAANEADGGEDELQVTIGDEPAEAETTEGEAKGPAPDWLKELRKTNREQARKIREFEEREQARHVAETAVAVGDEPTFEGCGYDADKLKVELLAWNDRKRAAEAKAADKQRKDNEAQASWALTVTAYEKAKESSKTKIRGFDEAEEAVKAALNVTQQGLILDLADSAESATHLIAALGKNPKLLKDMSAITNPVKFTSAMAKLETKLKVAPRKAPTPEREVRGGGGAVDSTLARLEAEADKTGDRTKVAAYRRDKMLQGRKAA